MGDMKNAIQVLAIVLKPFGGLSTLLLAAVQQESKAAAFYISITPKRYG
jgi:hypothetical protein